MHRLGMFKLGGIKAIFQHLNVTTLSEKELKSYRDIALDVTSIWVEGVLRDYVHKLSGGMTPTANVSATHRRKTRRARKKVATEKRRAEAEKRKAKEVLEKRRRLEHYYSMDEAHY